MLLGRTRRLDLFLGRRTQFNFAFTAKISLETMDKPKKMEARDRL
jgi:hypothetical protein